MKIYVGNLSYNVTDEDLKTAFEPYGQIESAFVLIDKITNRSKGFGFIEMPVKEEAEAAVEALNGTELQGRSLTVNEARPREEKGFHGNNRSGFQGGGNRGGFRGGQGGANRGGGTGANRRSGGGRGQ